MKKLKLRIAKFDRMLVVEQLERSGRFEKTKHTQVYGGLFFFRNHIDFQENAHDKSSSFREFLDNNERDEYAQKLINWITEEQFGGGGKLEIGKECLVSTDGKDWYKHHLLAILPINKKYRYVVCSNLENEEWTSYGCANPINNCLKVDGEIYTWEVEQ